MVVFFMVCGPFCRSLPLFQGMERSFVEGQVRCVDLGLRRADKAIAPENLQPLLESYQDALSSQQSTELEAMFLAALSLTRRLA